MVFGRTPGSFHRFFLARLVFTAQDTFVRKILGFGYYFTDVRALLEMVLFLAICFATHLAGQANLAGKVVWWAADQAAANYYSVYPKNVLDEAATSTNSSSLNVASPKAENFPSVFFTNSRNAECLASLPAPGIVVLSKIGIYDSDGDLRRWLTKNDSCQLEAFQLLPFGNQGNRKSEPNHPAGVLFPTPPANE